MVDRGQATAVALESNHARHLDAPVRLAEPAEKGIGWGEIPITITMPLTLSVLACGKATPIGRNGGSTRCRSMIALLSSARSAISGFACNSLNKRSIASNSESAVSGLTKAAERSDSIVLVLINSSLLGIYLAE